MMATIGKINNHIKTLADKNLKSFIMDLYNYVFIKNNWDLARFTFLNFKKHLPFYINRQNETEWNCFLSEYEAYMSIYNVYQGYDWTQICHEKSCRSRSGCSFLFRLR